MKVENGQAFVTNVVLNKERHGEEKVAAVCLKLKEIIMDASVLDELCPVSGYDFSEVMYVDKNPRLQQLNPLAFDLKLEPYVVDVNVNDVHLAHCTITKIKITPLVDRKVQVSLQVNTLMEDEFAAPLAKAKQEQIRFSMSPGQVDVEDPAEELEEAA